MTNDSHRPAEKLDEIRGKGINPYAGRYEATARAQDLHDSYGKAAKEDLEKNRVNVSLAGRIIAMRSFGKAAFSHIQDGSGKIQVYFQKNALGEDRYGLFKKLDIGDFIGATGTLFRTRSGEITLQASDLVLLAKSLHPLPEKWHGLADVEKRYRQRYLDLIVSEPVRQVFERRSRVIASLRRLHTTWWPGMPSGRYSPIV